MRSVEVCQFLGIRTHGTHRNLNRPSILGTKVPIGCAVLRLVWLLKNQETQNLQQ
jgi:hypothetical protein